MSNPAAAATEKDYASFGEFLDTYRREHSTPAMSALIVRDGQIVWEGYYGTYDDEGDMPTVPETTYSIASVTKPIAATAILAESLAGGLDLDTPMSADEGWADTCDWLSNSQIIFGAGGIDNHGNAVPKMDCVKPTTLADMLSMRANGDSFVYNPIAFARIDRVITGVGGRDLRDIVRERSAEPVGMHDVALGWHDPEGGAALRFLAPPYHVVEGELVKQAMSDDDFRAAAGIIASPRALAAFDIAFDEGLLIPLELRKRLLDDAQIPALGDYRIGWWLEDWHGRRLIWHSGRDDERYSAMYLKVPSAGLTLIVLANTEALWWGNSVVKAEIATSPVAARFLEQFVGNGDN